MKEGKAEDNACGIEVGGIDNDVDESGWTMVVDKDEVAGCHVARPHRPRSKAFDRITVPNVHCFASASLRTGTHERGRETRRKRCVHCSNKRTMILLRAYLAIARLALNFEDYSLEC